MCSSDLLHKDVYDDFIAKLKTRVEKITLGDPTTNPGMAAVINEASMKSILGYIEQGKKDGRLITGGERDRKPAKGSSSSRRFLPTFLRNRSWSRRRFSGRYWRS